MSRALSIKDRQKTYGSLLAADRISFIVTSLAGLMAMLALATVVFGLSFAGYGIMLSLTSAATHPAYRHNPTRIKVKTRFTKSRKTANIIETMQLICQCLPENHETIFFCGDIITERGGDQVLPHLCASHTTP